MVDCVIEVVLEHRSLPMRFDFLPHLDGSLTQYADLSALSPHGYFDFAAGKSAASPSRTGTG
jgi:hypothetical protein